MKSFKKYISEDKSLERALASDAAKPKKKPTLPKAPWDKKNEARDTHCSDECCGSDVKAEDCTCSSDCPHCNCNSEIDEGSCGSTNASYSPDAKRAGVGRTGETARERAKRLGKSQRESVEETFNPNHPKVKAARKAHKAGTWDGNVDKNGNAIVHINGKPHTVTKGDPAAKNEALDEISNDTLSSYKDKAKYSRDKAQNSAAANALRGTKGSGGKNDPDIKTMQKRDRGKKLYHSNIANKLRKQLADKNRAESLDEDTINNLTAAYINENNITMAELEAMSPEQLDEIIGKAIGGAFKVAAKTAVGTARLAGKTVGGAAKLAKKGANRVSTSGRADAAEKKAAAAEKKANDRKRIKDAKDRVRALKQKQAETKRNQNQKDQNKPKTA